MNATTEGLFGLLGIVDSSIGGGWGQDQEQQREPQHERGQMDMILKLKLACCCCGGGGGEKVNMVMDIVISVVLLLVGIAVLVVIHLCIVGRLFREGYRNGVPVQRVGAPTVTISSDDLDNLPCFDYAGGTGDRGTNNGPVDCPVCLESFKVGDKCRSLPNCNHGFHAQCIDSWLLKTPICPICRTPVVIPSRSFKDLVEETGAPGDVTLELT